MRLRGSLLGCVVAVVAGVAEASTPLVIYGRNPSAPRRWAYASGSRQGEQTLPSLSNQPKWIVAKPCPTRNEVTLAAVDYNSRLNVIVRSGGAWASVQTAVTLEPGVDL